MKNILKITLLFLSFSNVNHCTGTETRSGSFKVSESKNKMLNEIKKFMDSVKIYGIRLMRSEASDNPEPVWKMYDGSTYIASINLAGAYALYDSYENKSKGQTIELDSDQIIADYQYVSSSLDFEKDYKSFPKFLRRYYYFKLACKKGSSAWTKTLKEEVKKFGVVPYTGVSTRPLLPEEILLNPRFSEVQQNGNGDLSFKANLKVVDSDEKISFPIVLSREEIDILMTRGQVTQTRAQNSSFLVDIRGFGLILFRDGTSLNCKLLGQGILKLESGLTLCLEGENFFEVINLQKLQRKLSYPIPKLAAGQAPRQTGEVTTYIYPGEDYVRFKKTKNPALIQRIRVYMVGLYLQKASLLEVMFGQLSGYVPYPPDLKVENLYEYSPKLQSLKLDNYKMENSDYPEFSDLGMAKIWYAIETNKSGSVVLKLEGNDFIDATEKAPTATITIENGKVTEYKSNYGLII